jgi:nicotinamidase-related amidase
VTAVDALVLVDLQRAFTRGPHAVPDADRLLVTVGTLLAAARSAGADVLHLQNDGRNGEPDEPDTEGWELAVEPLPGEHVIRKHEDDGFAGTELEQRLGLGRRLLIAGVMSEMCVAATARGALARGHHVTLMTGGHATYDVPPGPGGSPGVPAASAARAAEWSLGDEVEVVGDAGEVEFVRR